ncbi:MAG TPA: hypothetical protein DGB72_11650 [Gemmatimonadetes bacterium]|nr:hypothetical protein [Gemmatimonadota bacterium]
MAVPFVVLELGIGQAAQLGLAEQFHCNFPDLGIPICDVVAAEAHILRKAADDSLGEVEQRPLILVQVGVITAQSVIGSGNLLNKLHLDTCCTDRLVSIHQLIEVVDDYELGTKTLPKNVREQGLEYQGID